MKLKKTLAIAICTAAVATFTSQAMANPAPKAKIAAAAVVHTVGKHFELKGVTTTAKTTLLAKEKKDVTGNGVADNIYLIGNKDAANGGLITDLNIIVQEGKTNKVINSNIKGFEGYQPTINVVGDFNGDKSEDVMISAYSGGNSGSTNAYIESFQHNAAKALLSKYVKVRGHATMYDTMKAKDVDKNGVYEIVATKTVRGSNTSVVQGDTEYVLAYQNGQFHVQSIDVKKTK